MKQPNRDIIPYFLDRYGVKAELTSTKRAAIHRYTFPKAEDAGFILDLDYSIQRQKNEQMELEVISDTEIRGRKKTVYWAFDQVYQLLCQVLQTIHLYAGHGLHGIGRRRSASAYS